MSSLSFQWIQCGERGCHTTPILQIRGLSVKVGLREVLTNFDMEVFPGDHVQITGPNGSGKSTLLNAIAGIEPALIISGQIGFNGQDITRFPAHERAALGISYMRQTENVFNSLTVSENLAIALGKNSYERFAQTFPDWANELPENKSAGQLSGGQKKKLAWSMTYLMNKKIFLADEPNAGVAGQFKIPNDDCTYLVITHE